MEKIKIFFSQLKELLNAQFIKVKNLLFNQKTELTRKIDLNIKNIAVLFFVLASVFLILGLFMPTEDPRVFRQVAKENPQKLVSNAGNNSESKNEKSNAERIWGNGTSASYSNNRGGGSQINYNTAMVMGSQKGNSRFEIHAGTKMKLQIIDKFVASQEGTPVIGKLLEDVTSESGSSIPEGSLLYGEAVYQKSSGKAVIQFKRVSYPSGSIHDIEAIVLGEDGMAGLEGNIKSDSVKNAVGQTITGFVGSLAAGSVEKDFMGNSKGGNTNGLYQAISETARNQAQKYGESLKESREWIEVQSGTSCEAVLQVPYQVIDLDNSAGGGT